MKHDYLKILYNKKVDVDTVLSTTSNNPVANKTIATAIPFKFGIDSSGNYGYKKAGADTVIPFKSQSDIDNAYNKGITDGKTDGKNEHTPMFEAGEKVGTIGRITDGEYNVNWVIYTISGNTYQLFPLKNLTYHEMNSNMNSAGGYAESEMYGFIHNTVLPNLRKSGLNIVTCDLVSKSVYNDICTKTGKRSGVIVDGWVFWLTDTYSSNNFYSVGLYGDISSNSNSAGDSLGVRPLITVVK